MTVQGSKRICVVAFNPGLVAAAVFDLRGSSPVVKKIWTGGKRPPWIRGASLDLKTLVLDARLPMLADGSNDEALARDRMARLGMDASSKIAVAGGCAVAVRCDGVEQAFALAADEDIVADAVTSFAAVELGAFFINRGSEDDARLSFFDKTAILTSRAEGKLSSRRFSLPGGADELSSTLRMLGVSQIDVSGDGEKFASALTQTGAGDRSACGVEKSYAGLVERAALMWASGNLAVFSTPRRASFNAAQRWLGPIAAAFAVLCVAAAFPLLDSCSRAREQNRVYSALAERDKLIQSRVDKNRPIMSRIETLSREGEARADELSRSRRVVEAVLAVQSAMKTLRHVSIESVEASDEGRGLAIAGKVARGTGGELDRFVADMAKSGFKPCSKVSLEDEGADLNFALEMKGAK